MVEHAIARAAGGLRLKVVLGLAALAAAAPVSAKGEPSPLFAADTPIEVTLSGPIRELVSKAERSTDPLPASLLANGETHAIQLSPRGNSRRRREVCQFPPFLVKFDAKPAAGSLFEKQGRLKLVDHCRNTDAYEKYVLREFAAYRLYNVLTPESLKVRLARMTYTDGGKQVANRWGFFIEDVDDAAKRIGRKELEVETVPSTALDPDDSARYVLFQYMIGNLDWDMKTGPKGSDCCHNSKLLGNSLEDRQALTPMPYDFDYAGLVDAPYAVPPESVPVKTVRNRYYRGLCRHNDAIQRAVPEFLAARPLLEAELRAIPQLDPKERDDMIKYLGGFFEELATPAKVKKNLLDNCR